MRNVAVLAGFVALLPVAASAQILYEEDFNADPSANWTLNAGPTDSHANFFFDYSSVGIPSAPGSGGNTTGMKLQANLTDGVFGGMSVSPNGVNLSGNYILSFDVWSNYVGPLQFGGSGSTNLSLYGVGTSGTTANYPGSVDGVWFGTTGDGGSSADWRAYSPDANVGYPDASPVFEAAGTGNRNHSHPYYSVFGGHAAPAAQLALFSQQTEMTRFGTAGMTWHQIEIIKDNQFVSWTMDGVLLATVDTTGMTLGGGNILFGHSDINSSTSSDPDAPDLLFTLVDNVVVRVPSPGSLGLLGLGGLLMVRRRR